MAVVSVLYLEDEIAGPHLQLIRNVCEPSSRSRPHVTVRYFERVLAAREQYLDTVVREIDLIEPGAFGLREECATHYTVYIRCNSDVLEYLEHKPHYPESEFHITLYDGESRDFAQALLQVVSEFPWRIRVRLPEETKLQEIEITPRKHKKAPGARRYNSSLKELFSEATSEDLNWDYLSGLSDATRLQLVRKICGHLHRCAEDYLASPTDLDKDWDETEAGYEDVTYNDEVHLTPPELARDIAKFAVGLQPGLPSGIDFGDPAVGTGVFYQALRQVAPSQINSAIGVDIDQRQVLLARRRWSHRGLKVLLGNYLHMERLPARTLILANPPYLRHQRIPSDQKEALRQRASVVSGTRVSAFSGLYVYFLLLSHAWMAPKGIAAWLIPSEFMQTQYGDALRQYLTRTVQLLRIHQFSPFVPQFENVDVMPSVVIFRNTPPDDVDSAVMSCGGTLSQPEHSETVAIAELRREAKWSIPVRRSVTGPLGPSLGDLFQVRRGIATGANHFFIIERGEAARLGIPDLAVRPILPKVRSLPTLTVEGEADGYPSVFPQLCLIDCDLSEDEIALEYPGLASYLAQADGDIRNRNLVRRRHPWYRQEQREPAPFLCTYMGRDREKEGIPPLRFIWNKSSAVAANTYLMLYPRKALAKLLTERPALFPQVFSLLQATAHSMCGDLRTYAWGLRKIEPNELLKVVLPLRPEWLAEALDSVLPLQ